MYDEIATSFLTYCAVPGEKHGLKALMLLYIACCRQKCFSSDCAVDIGEENPCNVCSGLAKHVPLEEMQVCR